MYKIFIIKPILFLLLYFFEIGYVQSQTTASDINFERITAQMGLSHSEVTFICEDSWGFMWFCTKNGLNRFDGTSFVKYFHDPSNSNSLPSSTIHNMVEDEHKNFWIATNNGIAYFNPFTNSFTNYLNAPDKRKELKGNFFHVMLDRAHTLWISSNSYLSKFNSNNKTFTHYPVDLGQSLAITRNDNVFMPFEDSKGRMWLPTSYGIKLFNRQTGQFISYHFTETNKASAENAVIKFDEDKSGIIYATTWGGGLLKFNEAKNIFENIVLARTIPADNYHFLLNIIFDILIDGDNTWLATTLGLVKMKTADIKPGQPVTNYKLYKHNSEIEQSLPSNEVKHLFKDRSGTIWIGTDGICKIDKRKQQFISIRNPMTGNEKINVSAFTKEIDGKAGSYILAGINLYIADSTLGKITPVNFTKWIETRNYGQMIWDIATGKNHFWLATTNGLLQLNKEKKVIAHYTFKESDSSSIPGQRLWKVYEDSKGLVWASTVRHGISILNPETKRIKNYFHLNGSPNSLFNQYTSSFFEDRQSNIWFGGNNQLYCYIRQFNQFEVYPFIIKTNNNEQAPSTPNPFLQDASGNIWTINEKGLSKFNPDTKQITGIYISPQEFNGYNCVAAGKDGMIWSGGANGLFRYDTILKQLKKFTAMDGLVSNNKFDALYSLPNGEMLLSGEGYITRFNPSSLSGNDFIPPVVITNIQLNGKDTFLYPDAHLRIKNNSGIAFEFAALNYSNAENNQYRYMLKGGDKNWIDAGGKRFITYSQLSPGTYTFMVMGSNNDGVWNKTPATFTFTVLPPFWRTWWFIGLLLLFISTSLYLLYRYRLRKALEMERLRTRIATDLHDDIGATLSSISMYSEAVKNQLKDKMPQLETVLDKMGTNSRDMVTSMSDIVWAINPDNDEGEKLIKRMENYAGDICAVKNIRLQFKADDKLQTISLPLEHRKNIYLIFKEAVNNAAKYADAKNIWVQLTLSGKALNLLIKDDGKGFNQATVHKGNGLKNFGARAKEIKGNIIIDSVAESGTTVSLQCSI